MGGGLALSYRLGFSIFLSIFLSGCSNGFEAGQVVSQPSQQGQTASIIQQPKSQSVMVGDKIEIQVLVEEYGGWIFSWEEADSPDAAYSEVGVTSNVLNISPAKLSDSGFYRLKIQPDQGRSPFYSETVQVAVSPRPVTSLPAPLTPPCEVANACREYADIKNGSMMLLYRTYTLETVNPAIDHLVIVLHGTDRDGDNYFNRMVASAKLSNHLARTLIVAPSFKVAGDPRLANELEWLQNSGGNSWKRGGDAKSMAFSSFEVVDSLVERVAAPNRFPNLKRVTIIGHSAGGQFVQRYAAGTRVDRLYPQLDFTFAPANPSSFMYLNDLRLVPETTNQFAKPANCAGYNDYIYGLNNRNRYMNLVSSTDLVQNYIARKVVYFQGQSDIVRDSNLDTTCAADAQGLNRYARGLAYFSKMQTYFAGHKHRLVSVPGVGHSSSGIFSSVGARSILWPN